MVDVVKSKAKEALEFESLLPEEKADKRLGEKIRPEGEWDRIVYWAGMRFCGFPLLLGVWCLGLKLWPGAWMYWSLLMVAPWVGAGVVLWRVWVDNGQGDRFWVYVTLGVIGCGLAVWMPHVVAIWV
jgi:hypothetical protein